jgi:hypothetical protein
MYRPRCARARSRLFRTTCGSRRQPGRPRAKDPAGSPRRSLLPHPVRRR